MSAPEKPNSPPAAPRKHFLEVVTQSFSPRTESDYLSFLLNNVAELLENSPQLQVSIYDSSGRLHAAHGPAIEMRTVSKDGYAYDEATRYFQLDLDGIQAVIAIEPAHAQRALQLARVMKPMLLCSLELVRMRSRRSRGTLYAVLAVLFVAVCGFCLVPVTESLRLEATTVAERSFVHAAPAASPVARLCVADGDEVKTGQMLIELDDKEISEQIGVKTQEILTARDQVSLLEREALQKEEKLAEKRVAESTLLLHEKELQLLRFQQSRLQVKALCDGVVHFDNGRLAVGRTVAAGEELCEVRSGNGVLEFYVPVLDRDVWDRRSSITWFAHDKPDVACPLRGEKLRHPDAVLHRDAFVYEIRVPDMVLPPGKTGLVQVKGEKLTLLIYTIRYVRKHLRW